MADMPRRNGELARRLLPPHRNIGWNPKPIVQDAARVLVGPPLAMQPAAHRALAASHGAGQSGKGHPLSRRGLPEEASPLRKLVAQLPNDQMHRRETYWYTPTLSTSNVGDRAASLPQPDDVAAKRDRGKKWANAAKAAGLRLKAERIGAQFSLDRVAEMAGSDKGSISRLEHGLLPEVAAGLFFDVCRALGLDPAAVWWGRAGANGELVSSAPDTVRGNNLATKGDPDVRRAMRTSAKAGELTGATPPSRVRGAPR